MKSLESDCLMEVLKFLNFKDQISLGQVNNNLKLAVTILWRIKYNVVKINFHKQHMTNEELSIFAGTIKDYVKTLCLRDLTKEKLDIIKQHCFKRVRSLAVVSSQTDAIEDDDIKDLKDIFPNLENFYPHAKLSGLYMDQWPSLKYLDLSHCSELKRIHFQTIISHLKLEGLKLNIFWYSKQFEQLKLVDANVENLEYLQLNMYEFKYFVTQPLKNLKELIITNHYGTKTLFEALLTIRPAKEIRLMETVKLDYILTNCLETQLNVEELTIFNDNFPLPTNIITSLYRLTDLRKLCFMNCVIISKDFNNLLKNIPQVHELSFEYCRFDAAKIVVKVKEVVAERTNKLKLNMFRNILITEPDWISDKEQIIVDVKVAVIGSHNLFKLTQLEGDYYCPKYLRVIYR